jgi:Glycosyltransferase like family 2
MEHKPTIAVLMPGEHFHRRWVVAWTNLLVSSLSGGYDIAPLFGFASSPHVTRGALVKELGNTPPSVRIDYVLWIDDDNIVTPSDVKRLLSILQSRPDVDIAAGWCWIEGDVESGRAARVSCGMWAKEFTQSSFSSDAMELERERGKLMLAEWTGFPCVLMRANVLQKLGEHPFAGIPSEFAMHGMWGEDISFCIRAHQLGLKIAIDPTVKVDHLKVQPVPDPPKRKVIDLASEFVFGKPIVALRPLKFSVCHTTARPAAWAKAYDAWRNAATGSLEYVLCMDERWGFSRGWKFFDVDHLVVWNAGRKCAVDGWNTAFQAATGDVLIMASDDMFPCQNWDVLLARAIGDRDPLKEDFAIRVNTPNPNQGRDLFPTIISRARYERLGYALYPEYDCMYADDDDCEHILLDVREGRTTLIDARSTIMFEERHPSFSGEKTDAVYDHQMRREAWTLGAEILQRRRAARFEGAVELQAVNL